jgi:hypothetical protein
VSDHALALIIFLPWLGAVVGLLWWCLRRGSDSAPWSWNVTRFVEVPREDVERFKAERPGDKGSLGSSAEMLADARRRYGLKVEDHE